MGRRSSRRHRRPQTPRPRRRSPDSVDSATPEDETDDDPNHYRHSTPVPVLGSYTPAPTHPGIPSVTTRTTIGSRRTRTASNNLRPRSRQESSRESSGLTYTSDDPAVMPPPPPGFVPYPDQDSIHRQMPFPTPRVPFQQSPLHSTPVPPPPQMQLHRDRASNNSQSD